jgi:hypothetical protein
MSDAAIFDGAWRCLITQRTKKNESVSNVEDKIKAKQSGESYECGTIPGERNVEMPCMVLAYGNCNTYRRIVI